MSDTKKYRLPREFTEKWLKALRSGEYSQATDLLYNKKENGYCCLGVSCAINYSMNYLKRVSNNFNAGLIEKTEDFLTVDLKKIPKELKGGSCVNPNSLVSTLTHMNDTGHSFEEIADWIEENVELYDKL